MCKCEQERREADFNPPTSCEVGRFTPAALNWSDIFQSTHLLRGGTLKNASRVAGLVFQSTHLLRGGTDRSTAPRAKQLRFQSTHLLRGGTWPLFS